ncbi:hypothetical protein BDN70DRAFT_997131 [Pholiota conissans]|uniref:Asl1-like glycosyl hydrolase catalytic domain-containing protein n=1 Tax=Pholiota conissans TaxID=109636 RepID=A0A9P6CVM1_9AGAR|nr:hypothetical protein BDN70DRAFT_997131 [Pholiota conissans]
MILAGNVGANHIKRHHPFQSQCRPRLPSTKCGGTSTVHTTSSSHAGASSTIHSKPTSTLVTSTTETVHTTSSYSAATLAHTTSSTTKASGSSIHASASASAAATPSAQPQSASFIPNSVKAGIAGGDSYSFMENHIGWWYDWSPTPSKPGSPIAVPMLWGNGTVDSQDASRLAAFEKLLKDPSADPRFVLGFEEPDCPSGSGSAGMTVEDGVQKWESLIAPFKAKGTKLVSPGMCKQIDETWLAQFQNLITTPWDITAVHINKNSLDGVKADIKHYMTYGKPIWVTEFACVDDYEKFEPCTNQDEINGFINNIVDYFEGEDGVFAYAYSNGLGLGDAWPLMDGDSLSESGRTYLAAISKYH